MPAGTRPPDGRDTGPERLADAVQALAGAGDVDRMCAIALQAALALSGATSGRVVLEDGDTVAERVTAGTAPAADWEDEPLMVGGRRAGLLQLSHVPDEVRPSIRVLAVQLGLGLANVDMERAAEQQRDRAQRFAEAIRAVRVAQPTDQAVLRLLEEARGLVDAGAAALVTGMPGDPGPTVSVGLDPDTERELGALVAGPLSSLVSLDQPWTGPLPSDMGVREQGLAGLVLLPVGGEGDRIGTLAVVTRGASGATADELEALWGLADHAAAALGAAALRQRLDDLGTVDPVTRFFNARYFTTRLEQETHRAMRGREPLSLVVFGIDGLEQLRAVSGERMASEAVSALADHLVPRLRATDVGCRTGADELSVILPGSEGLDAFRIAERIRAGFIAEAGLTYGVSVSAGVASFPDQAGAADQLSGFARTALSMARRHGGERTFLYDRDVAALLDEEDRRHRVVEESLVTTISALAVAVDERHPTTRDHSQNVARVAALIAQEMGMGPEQVEEVRLAGLLHDVGKIGVSDELLTRPGPLEPHEWEEIRQHPEIGYRMLSGTRLRGVRTFVRHHHERWDGGGYPQGLAGEDIPAESRIIAVANALDSMTNDRPYRLAFGFEYAVEQIESRAGSQFCPATVDALMRLIARDPAWVRPEPGA
ncbi:MAG: HD domain-containing protein [Thermoleophilia bacterium]